MSMSLLLRQKMLMVILWTTVLLILFQQNSCYCHAYSALPKTTTPTTTTSLTTRCDGKIGIPKKGAGQHNHHFQKDRNRSCLWISGGVSSSSSSSSSEELNGDETNKVDLVINANHDTTTTTNAHQYQHQQEVLYGRGLLCCVALLYGTLNVSLRLVYQLDDPPTAAALSAARGWLAAIGFLPLLWINTKHNANNNNNNNNNDTNENQPISVSSSATTTTVSSSSLSSSSFWWAGLELAIYNFLAQGLLNIGLLSTGSARASFLTQLSVILTPLVSLIFGQAVPKMVWMACPISLVGLSLLSGIINLDISGSSGNSAALGAAFSRGDLFVLGGTLSWSMYLFRLSRIGSKFEEIPLQALKTILLAILYTTWLIGSIASSGGSLGSILSLGTGWGWMTQWIAWAALTVSAIGPGTLADVLQQQGQKQVSASEANVILSMEPVFAALFARLLLGEVTSLPETLGGGLILIAALIATRK